jgi:hypothetical protein
VQPQLARSGLRRERGQRVREKDVGSRGAFTMLAASRQHQLGQGPFSRSLVSEFFLIRPSAETHGPLQSCLVSNLTAVSNRNSSLHRPFSRRPLHGRQRTIRVPPCMDPGRGRGRRSPNPGSGGPQGGERPGGRRAHRPRPRPRHLERRSRRPLLPYPQASRAGAPVNRTRSPKLRSGGSEATHTCPGWGLTGFHLVRPSI